MTAAAAGTTPGANARRPLALRIALALLAALLFAGFFALGTWQVERRAWKLALIERTDQRVHAAPVAPPAIDRWPQVDVADDEYRHVQLDGRFLHDKETLVQATTDLGSGYWVLTPLQLADGSIVLVNRGFVLPAQRERGARADNEPAGPVRVTGLLRMTEPKGALLRRNEPAAGRWYSRDVKAIAEARGLPAVAAVAPYFVDLDADPGAARGRPPVGGLTVIAFNNNHLVYALTWYSLALMMLGLAWHGWREGRREERRAQPPQDDDRRD